MNAADVMEPPAEAALAEALAACDPLARLFSAAGHRLFLVGGVVRDALIGRFVAGADIDCTTAARPDAVRRIVSEAASALWSQGERYGTIGCLIGGQAFEITTHRAERYGSDSRKPVVAFGDDLIEDLSRRDFTVNAMAVDAADGTLFDPYGGARDLAAAVLRTPLDPEVSFADDPLRMLRAARLAAGHGLEPSGGVLEAVRAMGGRLRIVATERVRAEFEKLLLLPDPAQGLEFLFRTGLVEHAVPFLRASEPVTLGRTVAATRAVAAERWASLFVDRPEGAAGHLRAMRCSTELIVAVTGLLAGRDSLAVPPQDAAGIRRLVHACGGRLDSVLDFTTRAAAARGEPTDPLERFRAALVDLRSRERVDDVTLPVTGIEVMDLIGLEPGPAVGQALAHLRELMFEKGPLTRAEAVAALRQWAAAGHDT